jgi:hypothetical protein
MGISSMQKLPFPDVANYQLGFKGYEYESNQLCLARDF